MLTEAVRLGRRTGDGKLARELAGVQKHLADVSDGKTQVPAKQDEGGLLVTCAMRVIGGA